MQTIISDLESVLMKISAGSSEELIGSLIRDTRGVCFFWTGMHSYWILKILYILMLFSYNI